MSEMWFSSFREHDWNTYYTGLQQAADVDIAQLFIIFFAAILALVMVVLVVGSKGPEVSTSP